MMAMLFVSSCAGNRHALPIWVSTPPQDTYSSLYGIGQGSSLQSSNVAALKNAITKLGVTISGVYQQRMAYRNQEEQSFITDNIDIALENTSISSYQQVKSENVNDTIFTLIKIDKPALIKDYQQSLFNVSAGVKSHIKDHATDKGLTWLIRAKHILNSEQAITAQRISAILSVIDPFHDLDVSDSPLIVLANLVESYEKPCVAVNSKGTYSIAFVDAIQNHLKGQGFVVSNTCAEKLHVNVKQIHRMYYGMFVTRNELTLTLNDGFQNTVKLTSQSATSFEQSRLNNLAQFNVNLHSDYLWETLGVITDSNL